MPVNKKIGKLWFESQEAIDRYDDLVVSNIELKEGENMDDPNYTFISPRARKEIMPGFSEKALEEIRRFQEFKPDKSREHSYRYFYEWPAQKYMVGIGVGYLIMRELPIRNFYARSLIMGFYIFSLREMFQWRGFGRAIETTAVANHDPNYMLAKQEAI